MCYKYWKRAVIEKPWSSTSTFRKCASISVAHHMPSVNVSTTSIMSLKYKLAFTSKVHLYFNLSTKDLSKRFWGLGLICLLFLLLSCNSFI